MRQATQGARRVDILDMAAGAPLATGAGGPGRARAWRRGLAALLCALCCLGAAPAVAQRIQPFSATIPGDRLPAPWRVVPFPGGSKPVTQFETTMLEGTRVLKVLADKSYGSVLHEVAPVVLGPGSRLRWRWRLEQPLLQSDLRRRDGDDSAIKVCALFDMAVGKLGVLERAMLSLARSRTSDPIPAATLCYVWDHLLPEGTALPNAFSARIKFVVMDSGETYLSQWRVHERDLAADFMQAFGRETDDMPPLIGIAIGADSDNTKATSLAYVGDIALQAAPAIRP